MRRIWSFLLILSVIASPAFLTLVPTLGFPEEAPLIHVGPRLGLSGQTFLGKEQQHNFRLYDVAAMWRLPWGWALRQTGWRLETRLLTSAGAISGAGETGFVATTVPTLALTSRIWTLDGGAGPGFFSNYTFGTQSFGGPVQIVATVGIGANLFSHGYVGFRLQHFSDAALYSQASLGVDMYLVEIAYRF